MRVYTTSNTQAIQQIRHCLDTFINKDNADWNKHVSSFLDIYGELATFDEMLSDKDKFLQAASLSSQLICTPPMMSNLADTAFDSLANAVEAEVVRRKNFDNLQQASTPSTSTQPKANTARNSERKLRGYQCNTFSSPEYSTDENCYYCARRGHYASEGYKRKRDEANDNGDTDSGDKCNNTDNLNRQSNQSPTQTPCSHLGPSDKHRDRNRQSSWKSHFSPIREDNGDKSNNHRSYVAQKRDDLPPLLGCGCNMATFKSQVVHFSQSKFNSVYIDSGATHQFFQSRSSFIEYEAIDVEQIQAALGAARLVGKVHVWRTLINGTFIEAYHAPAFQSNILSVGIISTDYCIAMHSRARAMVLLMREV